MSATIDAHARSLTETRLAVEDFIYTEAALLDRWELDEWLELFTKDECRYEVAPTDQDDPFALSSRTTLFLIGDNRERLEQRVIRLNKPTAHVEYPRSRTRHLYTNVRVIRDDGKQVTATANFVTYRTKNKVTTHYPGTIRYILERSGDTFLIREKRVAMDLEALIPQGKVSIIL